MKTILAFPFIFLLFFCFQPNVLVAEFDQWEEVESIPKAKAMTAAAVFDGKIYIFGGTPADGETPYQEVDIYDPATNSWDTLSAPDFPVPIVNTHANTVGDKIYVLGGADKYARGDATVEFYDDAYMFDPVNLTWDVVGEMPVASWYHSSIAWNNKIYNFGMTESIATPKTIVFDPELMVWDTLTDYLSTRAFSNAQVLNNHIYLAGGLFLGEPKNNVNRCDPVNESWEVLSILPDYKWWHGSGVIDQTLYVFGGLDGSISNPGDGSSGMWYYQWGDDSWVETAFDMPENLFAFSSVVATDNEDKECLFAIGGVTGSGDSQLGEATSKVYKFCPTESTSNISDLPLDKKHFNLLPNPVVEEAIISFELQFPEHITINIYDMAGKNLGTIVNGNYTPGKYQIRWTIDNLIPGMYVIEFKKGQKSEFIKSVIQ